ncbi:MAG: elongation factor G [bacterium]
MAKYTSEDIRNVVFLGEGGNGKTSLVEACLFASGNTDRQGKIDEENSILDSEPEEHKRRSSILSSVAHADWDSSRFNLIDTPGFSNFIADTIASIRVADNAVLVMSGHSEPKVITEKTYNWATNENIPTFIFINQMDHEQADLNSSLENAEKSLGKRVVPLNIPVGSGGNFTVVVDLLTGKAFQYDDGGKGKEVDIPSEISSDIETYRSNLFEFAAETSEDLLEKFLEEGELSSQELVQGLKNGISDSTFLPALFGCGLKNIGTDLLMRAIVDFGMNPLQRISQTNISVLNESGEESTISTDNNFRALVFKTVVDSFAGKLNYFRIFSGKTSSDSSVFNPTKKEKERLGALLFLQGKNQSPVDSELVLGDIAAVAKLKFTETGDTLCDSGINESFKSVAFPSPVISYAVAPKTKGDEEKLSTAFARMRDEDPVLEVSRDPQTQEMLISGLGVLHLEIVVERLKRKYGVELEMQTPRVPYKETIRGKSKVQGRYKKQTGGKGQFGDTWLEIEPLTRGEGFKFTDKIVGGVIPKTYIPAVEKGIVEAMDTGSLAGYPVTDIAVTLFDGSFHAVDSSEMAFKIAGSLGFKKGMLECKPVLLEPIMNMEVIIPEEFMGDVIGDLNSRRGRVLGMDAGSAGKQVVKAEVPMAEVLNYAPSLRSMTADRGDFTIEFSKYEEVPGQIAEKVISESMVSDEE